jgi:hypothetical protein
MCKQKAEVTVISAQNVPESDTKSLAAAKVDQIVKRRKLLVRTQQERADKETSIEKLTTKIDLMSAKSAELKEEIAELEKEVAVLAKARAEEMDKVANRKHDIVWEVLCNKPIAVRQGQSLDSEREPLKLEPGALLKEMQVCGNRLQFQLLSGVGPSSGWASIELQDGTVLCRPSSGWASMEMQGCTVLCQKKAVFGDPGMYKIAVVNSVVANSIEPAAADDEAALLDAGCIVEVLEVITVKKICRIRARIKSPEGWISLKNTQTGERFADVVQAGSLHTPLAGVQFGPGGSWQNYEVVHCDAQVTQIGKYAVYFQTPSQKLWDDTWDDCTAVVLLFHGTEMQYSSLGLEYPFRAQVGSYTEERVQTIKLLLEKGFAVVAPEARHHKTNNGFGCTYWDINKYKYVARRKDWKLSNDAQLMKELCKKFKGKELHAVGFSSGGYHLSRVGNDPELSNNLASISSLGAGCWTNCYFFEQLGLPCPTKPDEIIPTHPPTQFLQGAGDWVADNQAYHERLQTAKVKTRSITVKSRTAIPLGPCKGLTEIDGIPFAHMWIPKARSLILEWIEAHRKESQ